MQRKWICWWFVWHVAIAHGWGSPTPGELSADHQAPQGLGIEGLGESFARSHSPDGQYKNRTTCNLSPSIAFQYRGGKGRGELGQSWFLPTLVIYRMTDKGFPSFTDADRFAVSGGDMNEELVLVNPVSRWYRMRNSSNATLFRYDAGRDSWTILSTSGTTMYLGSDGSSRFRGYRDRAGTLTKSTRMGTRCLRIFQDRQHVRRPNSIRILSDATRYRRGQCCE
jgi:hypothetical protein